MEQNLQKKLETAANNIRILSIEGVFNAKSGHPGGSLSIADIMAYLYFYKMNQSASDPQNPDRDRFVLSKGHGAPALYGALALNGYFPIEDMKILRGKDSYLQGHPDMNKVNGVDMSTGSLGQGISAACGMALAGKTKGKSYKTYCIIGDGEMQEGQVWEAAMFAAHYKLGNLTVFADNNDLQIDGNVKDVMNVHPIGEKFKAFGWHVVEINGHDFNEIDAAVTAAEKDERPTAIICKTIKGKGVSFMENEAGWHGKAPGKELYDQAMSDLGELVL